MKKLSIVGIYSLIHFIVDMSCALLVVGVLSSRLSQENNLAVAIVLYNFFAFVFQLPFGMLADKLNRNALVSAIGCLCIILAYSLNSFGLFACFIAGIGNALFHVGGGIDVLNIADKKATLPGVYVSTGALGLFIGAKSKDIGLDKISFIAIIILVISILLLIWLYKQVKTKYKINNEKSEFKKVSINEQIIIYCVFIIICVRGYMGMILNFDWKSNFLISTIVVLAVVLGKMFGGVLGDRFGWKKVSTLSLVISAILFIFSFDNMICGIIAILLFNMTMPITLIVLSNVLNKNKGMAFGLTTVALFIGAVPTFLGYKAFLFDKVSLFIVTIVSAVILYLGLTKYEKLEKNE